MICATLGHLRQCSSDYELGSQSDGIMAVLLGSTSSVPSSSSHTLSVVATTTDHGQPSEEVLAKDEITVTLVGSGQCTPRAVKRKIYDSFTFFNELDLLELRLRELSPVVDYFILIEAEVTHSSRPKPLYFQDNQDRFEAYLDRIVHVQLEEDYILHGTGGSHWARETKQRDALIAALKQQQMGGDRDPMIPFPGPEDLILLTDVDELPRREVLEELKACEEAVFPSLLLMDWYLYSMKWRAQVPWGLVAKEGPVVVRAGSLFDGPQPPTPTAYRRLLRIPHIRSFASMPLAIYNSSGWHLSSFGGAHRLKEKLLSHADDLYHQDILMDTDRLARLIHFGVPYFYMGSMQGLEDNPFVPVPAHRPQKVPHTLHALLQGEGLEEDPTTALEEGLFFPSATSCSADSSHPALVTDERWLRQDLLLARHHYGADGRRPRLAFPRVMNRKAPHTAIFTYDCLSDYITAIQVFCTRSHMTDCQLTLEEMVRIDCSSSSSAPSGNRSVEVDLGDSRLIPLQLLNQTFIVEYMPGNNAIIAGRRACSDFSEEIPLSICSNHVQLSVRYHLATETLAALPPQTGKYPFT